MRDVINFVPKKDYLCLICRDKIGEAAGDISERAEAGFKDIDNEDGFFVLCTKCISKIFITSQ